MIIYLYGPSGSGKSTVGRLLADSLDLPFIDLDDHIVAKAGCPVAEIFTREGESGFRGRESAALIVAASMGEGVVALGGGALLAESNRFLVEATGQVVCLVAPLATLVERLLGDDNPRPLILGGIKDIYSASSSAGIISEALYSGMADLLTKRTAHYASFSNQIDTGDLSPELAAWQVQVKLGVFRVDGMGLGYDVRVVQSGLARLGEMLNEKGLAGPIALISDSNVVPIYGQKVFDGLRESGYAVRLIVIPAGEKHKTISTLQFLWNGLLNAELERRSTVVALGGGVVSDLAGFAAATYLRGVTWVAVPTSLLAMIDASLGGKTAVDMAQGKNLVGAFHAPALVLADPEVLRTLPDAELRSGLAEVVKHGVIGDPFLFDLCELGWPAILESLDEIVRRAMAVKIKIIQADPYEKGLRASLNLGHSLGHALELVSDYRLRHGEAVAIGMVAVARYAERAGLAEAGLSKRIRKTLVGLGLPVDVPPGMEREKVIAAIGVDKKRKGSKVRLALPVGIGEVAIGIALDDPALLLESFKV